MFKLHKALYGLKQSPRAWNDRLSLILISQGFKMSNVDTTLFTKGKKSNLIIVQVYVDDIMFRSKDDKLWEEFTTLI